MKRKSLREQLLSGEKKLGVWGLGYIGFSSINYFARAGVRCLGTDVDPVRIKDINEGRGTIPNIEYWLGFDSRPLAKTGMMKATLNWRKLIDKDIGVHLIAIPTEKDGAPYYDILEDVLSKLCNYKNMGGDPPLIVIESTITPRCIDEMVIPLVKKNGMKVGKDVLVGVAPRRDWFTSPDKNLENIPRVVGGTTPETTDLMAEVMGIICKNVLKAPDHKHAAVVKGIENTFRQMDITLANQLSLAYPDLDMVEILKLVGTKWNVETYHPSVGTGGYCIPLAPQYVVGGADHPEELTLLEASIESDRAQPERVVESILKRGAKKVGILGITYTADLDVTVLSPAIPITRRLKEAGVKVKANDPYYTDQEIKDLLGVKRFWFPDGLKEFDTLIILAGHNLYTRTPNDAILKNLDNCKLIIDNMGTWKDLPLPGSIEYHEVGGKGWLGPEGAK
jgi:nucleotide sugar dehydrogenase